MIRSGSAEGKCEIRKIPCLRIHQMLNLLSRSRAAIVVASRRVNPGLVSFFLYDHFYEHSAHDKARCRRRLELLRSSKASPLKQQVPSCWSPCPSTHTARVMDELPENRQQEEITALKSIYGDDFIDCPPPKAWKVRGPPANCDFNC